MYGDFQLIKDVVEGRAQLGCDLDAYLISNLIIETNNFQYIKDCLEGKVNIAVSLDKNNILNMLEKSKDTQILKDCIEGRIQLGFELGKYEIQTILRTTRNQEFIKQCIEGKVQLGYNLYPGDITNLLMRLRDTEYIKKCIRNREELKLNLNQIDICNLIVSTADSEYIKECIKSRAEYKFDQPQICKLILSTSDPQYIKECIDNRKQMGFSSESINELVEQCLQFSNTKEFANEWIDNWQEMDLHGRALCALLENADREIAQKYAQQWLKSWKELQLDGQALCTLIKITDNNLVHQINFDRLEEILSMKEADYIKGYLLDNVILNNMGQQGVNIEGINAEIEKIHEIFLTSTLPDNFKMFQFFKYHKNHDSSNRNLYNEIDTEERDKIISGDLFRVSLESGNIKMRTFLELLHNGNLALNQGNTNDELSQAILLEYRDILYSLSDVTEGTCLTKTQDYMQDLSRIREFLNLNDGDDIGEALLNRYFEGTGLDYSIEGQNLVDTLLNVMECKTKEAHNNNQRPFSLSQGDLIKGTNIQYLEDFLRNGIRAKEFLMVGSVNSDATPLDTDFSEISEENLQNGSLSSILNSTYTGSSYGNTYLVIKRENYEGDEVGYSEGVGSSKTRYFRTGMGSTNISAIITSEWDEEYKYLLARNGAYIPVINKDDGKVLFTIEEYESIRQQMQGLSHFGVSQYTLDDTAYDEDLKKQADKLRKSAEGKASTEEKRKAVVGFIRKHIGREITTEMLGDISSRYLELIDTGSTGRGTNIPGDGDFDFMLKCSSRQEQEEMIEKIKTFLTGKDKGGTGQYAIRYTDVEVEGIDEPVEVDVTAEQKRLEVDYSSDLAIRDRLSSIRRQYGEEGLRTVVDNIIVAKKILKENGVYKKVGSTGATEYGGFGGIGVESWILQNGGSLTKAMQTFIEHTVDEKGEEVSFSEFKRRYPIYDFGQNHRFGSDTHDHFIEGLSEKGFEQLKALFREQLKDKESTIDTADNLGDSIIQFTTRAEGYTFSDMSQIYSLVARLKTHEQSREQQGDKGEK